MIDAKAAANKAAEYLNDVIPQSMHLLLEEVEKTSIGPKPAWSITLSFQLPPTGMSALSAAMGKREYKTFVIDGASGEVVSMKIRSL